MCFLILGSCCHSASIIPFICSAEITRVVTFVSKWKTVHNAWLGRGNLLLKSVSKLLLVLHSHSLTLLNKCKGMSVRAFSMPGIQTGVSGHVCLMLRQRASTRTSCAAIHDFCNAILLTQLTVGKLLLNSAMCLCAKSGAIASTQSHRNSRPAISRSELLSFPAGLSKETRSFDFAVGHWSQKTVGGRSKSSLTTTPPTLWLEALTIPM
jgi:hypothetical protein